jgi:hypothetical protein
MAVSFTEGALTTGIIKRNRNSSLILGFALLSCRSESKSEYILQRALSGCVAGRCYPFDRHCFACIDSAYLADQTNLAAATGWFNGDFNYDGVINGSDYTLIDNAFNTQGAQLSAELANPTAQLGSETTSAVPEPSSFTAILLATVGLLRRRQKQSPAKQ